MMIIKTLVLVLVFSFFAASVMAINVTTVYCSGNIAKLDNGSAVCVTCAAGSGFNNVTGGCDLLEPISPEEKSLSVLVRWGGVLVPEFPLVGVVVIVVGFITAFYVILSKLDS